MVCCIVIKSREKRQTLLLNRQRQALLGAHLESKLYYKPFIFNSVKGTYIFIKKRETFEEIEHMLIKFFSEHELSQIKICDTTFRPHFFQNLTRQTLNSNDISALEWKRFISSFLFQFDPYSHSGSFVSITVFKRFHNNIKMNGSKLQRKFFKRRMKMLRQRVSIKVIENMLRID